MGMGFMVTFIYVNEDEGTSLGRSWIVGDPHVEAALRHIAQEHLGEPFMESTGEEAFEETKALAAAGALAGADEGELEGIDE